MKTNLRVKIKNVDFSVACEIGEEEKIKKLANSLNRRLNLLTESFPGTNLMTLFLINSIMIEDEINDLKTHNQELARTFDGIESKDNSHFKEYQANIQYNEITEYIENLIEKIEN